MLDYNNLKKTIIDQLDEDNLDISQEGSLYTSSIPLKNFETEPTDDLEGFYNDKQNQYILSLIHNIDINKLAEDISNKIYSDLSSYRIYIKNNKGDFKRLNESTINDLVDYNDNDIFLTNTGKLSELGMPVAFFNLYIKSPSYYFNKNNVDIFTKNKYLVIKEDDGGYASIKSNDYTSKIWLEKIDEISSEVNNLLISDKILKSIFSNQRYQQYKNKHKFNSIILQEIPKDFTSLYPLARVLKRHFVLHIGDTNTGKTYQAIQEFKEAESGVYLAPLRLLALEIQERLNDEGVPCSMSTGEEEDIIPEATHMSSTIEKLDIDKFYNVCVIDEAQMIDDNDRGWAWTVAILGAYAEKIHICMSENARDIVIKLIELCNDTYEIIEHKRNTQLVFEKKPFNFNTDIKDHDALILFSRKKVLSVATELSNMGIEASVIYGALPYSVRKNEIRKFIEGETKVVVSTDAIGMGMNLPIKRIVFLESTKFDGTNIRYLESPEVKQIAGRAGRQGMFDTGYVASMVDCDIIEDLLYEEYEPIKYAKIQLPKSLLDLNMKLSEILVNWNEVPDDGCFKKSDIERDLRLCLMLEDKTELSKEAILDLINIPFDERSDVLEKLWLRLIDAYYNKNEDIIYTMDIPEAEENDTLETLELKYKMLDLYFSFSKVVNYSKDDFQKNIMALKEELSIAIMEKLKTKEMYRTCKLCGRRMMWDYPYSICEKCHKKREKRKLKLTSYDEIDNLNKSNKQKNFNNTKNFNTLLN
jgi:ATP-dependent RNA helicase SUPV3L1/SUV3